jgi:hypothetical protein
MNPSPPELDTVVVNNPPLGALSVTCLNIEEASFGFSSVVSVGA